MKAQEVLLQDDNGLPIMRMFCDSLLKDRRTEEVQCRVCLAHFTTQNCQYFHQVKYAS